MYKENFVVDSKGKRIAVMIPIKEYNQMLEELEDLEDLKAYEDAKAKNEPTIPLKEAFKTIEANRKKKK